MMSKSELYRKAVMSGENPRVASEQSDVDSVRADTFWIVDVDGVKHLPLPKVTYADHSYPAYSKEQMMEAYQAGIASKDEWQPISTAPKDGTVVMAFWPTVIDGGKYCIEPTKYVGWSWSDPDDVDNEYCEPTHWMPLPNPPRS